MFPEELSGIVRTYNDQYLRDCQDQPIKPDRIPPFELEKAPKESLNFLRGHDCRRVVHQLYLQYKKDFGTKSIAWEDYFVVHAMRSRLLEEQHVEAKEGTVFEQLAAYLAVSPHDSNGPRYVYQKLGSWLGEKELV